MHFKIKTPYNIAADTDNLLVNLLPQYKIELQFMPSPREVELLNGQQSYCISNRMKTKQRERINLYSLPVKLVPGIKLFWLKNNPRIPPSLHNQQLSELTLEQIFEQFPNGVLGIDNIRSYGQVLDEQIQSLNSSNLFIHHRENHFLPIIRMLNDGKFDFMLEFPTEIQHFSHLLDSPDQLKSSNFNGVERYNVGYLACSKTTKNRHFLTAVNKALKQLYHSNSFYQAHARYIPNDDLPSFKFDFEQFFRQ